MDLSTYVFRILFSVWLGVKGRTSQSVYFIYVFKNFIEKGWKHLTYACEHIDMLLLIAYMITYIMDLLHLIYNLQDFMFNGCERGFIVWHLMFDRTKSKSLWNFLVLDGNTDHLAFLYILTILIVSSPAKPW